jgi:hypothetical protein
LGAWLGVKPLVVTMVQRREQHDHNDDRNNEKIVKIGVHEVRASQAHRYNEIIAIPDIVTTSVDCKW